MGVPETKDCLMAVKRSPHLRPSSSLFVVSVPEKTVEPLSFHLRGIFEIFKRVPFLSFLFLFLHFLTYFSEDLPSSCLPEGPKRRLPGLRPKTVRFGFLISSQDRDAFLVPDKQLVNTS